MLARDFTKEDHESNKERQIDSSSERELLNHSQLMFDGFSKLMAEIPGLKLSSGWLLFEYIDSLLEFEALRSFPNKGTDVSFEERDILPLRMKDLR